MIEVIGSAIIGGCLLAYVFDMHMGEILVWVKNGLVQRKSVNDESFDL